ncbi:MAG TPA: response regulator transcription factor [Flavobacterium sp.]|jgi:DNA-binding response OmpR family regulator|uniref:response regulator transcription factor n=1 Tax=Flavobacterium sp. TaxID=239 RepID=UPI001B5C8037|nr:response regulator transcription factor [Flavobacterium sp.]MBP6146790.1 response regulator transcription factor [Flavobacterium sp.]MBP7183064.1 response regulator transcription factor [Flavobacterium sp.]MBP8887679.1 response regulator transcription factor [Flavobacterium sp.]HRL72429.1 response regulator transcription factor [Flavobacterium sp.]HRM12417.1 response regulator transcription factor [Flavobacterium sp.]
MHILIVEDETGIIQFLQQGLEEEGYTITTAFDGLKGFELSQKENFDLILLDWMLPKMTGVELCKAIRLKNSKTPILFLTAKDTVQETIEGLKAGANDYIKKPFNFDELVERIKIHFRNQKEDEILTLGTIEIDIAQHQVLVNKNEVALTQREFELLTYLVRNKGKVCTRTQIIEDVWDIHFEYDTGVIDVFMNGIRKKLNLKIEQDYIKTVRGVGYIAND